MLHNSNNILYIYIISAEQLVIDDAESVSPPHTPLSSGIRLIPDKEDPIDDFGSKYLYISRRFRKKRYVNYFCIPKIWSILKHYSG